MSKSLAFSVGVDAVSTPVQKMKVYKSLLPNGLIFPGFIMWTSYVSRYRSVAPWRMRMQRWSQCGLPCDVGRWCLKKSMRDVRAVSLLCLGSHRCVCATTVLENTFCCLFSSYVFMQSILCVYVLLSGDRWHRESVHLWLCIRSHCWTRGSLPYGRVLLIEWAFQRYV